MKENYTQEFEDNYDRWAQEMDIQRQYEDKYQDEEISRRHEKANRIKNKKDREDYLMCADMSDYEMGVLYYGAEERGD